MKVVRVLQYEGPDEWVKEAVANSIQEERRFGKDCIIRGATVADPDLADYLEKELLNDLSVVMAYPGAPIE